MADVLDLSAVIALNIVVPWAALRFDMKRLPPERLARVWNDASFWSAVVVFGPLCLPVHFTRTRRSVWGLVLGFAVMVATGFAIELGGRAVHWVAAGLA